MTQAKQAENSCALARQHVAKGWRHPDSGGHRFMAWLGRTAQQHGSSHPPSFFPATRTVSAKLTHPAGTHPSHGTRSAEDAAFTTDPSCCCSLHPARKTAPCGSSWAAKAGPSQLLRFLCSHQEESWVTVAWRFPAGGLSSVWKVERLHKPGRHQN